MVKTSEAIFEPVSFDGAYAFGDLQDVETP